MLGNARMTCLSAVINFENVDWGISFFLQPILRQRYLWSSSYHPCHVSLAFDQHLGCCLCGLPLSQWASTRESNSGHCLWLLCCVGWAGVLWKECWAWSWSLLRCEHFLLSPCVRRDALTAKSQQQQWHNRLGRGNHKEWSSDVVCAHLDVGGLQDKGCLLFTFKWL